MSWRFRDTELSEEELCLLMGQFVIAAQQGNHQAQGWPNTAYGTTKVGFCLSTQLLRGMGKVFFSSLFRLEWLCCPGFRLIFWLRPGQLMESYSMPAALAGSALTWQAPRPPRVLKKEHRLLSIWHFFLKWPRSHMDSWCGTRPFSNGRVEAAGSLPHLNQRLEENCTKRFCQIHMTKDALQQRVVDISS